MPRRKLTDEQIDAIRRGDYGARLRTIAARLGVSPSTVSKHWRSSPYEKAPNDDGAIVDIDRYARIERAARAAIMQSHPVQWQEWRFDRDVDAIALHDELREALGISLEEWQAAK